MGERLPPEEIRETLLFVGGATLLLVGGPLLAADIAGAATYEVGWRALYCLSKHPTLAKILGLGGSVAARELADPDDDEVRVARAVANRTTQSTRIPDYSSEAGQALVDDVVQNEFGNVRLSAHPQYDPALVLENLSGKADFVNGVPRIRVGPFPVGEGYRDVLVTIAHEGMHHRMWSRGIFGNVETYVEAVAQRFATLKGW